MTRSEIFILAHKLAKQAMAPKSYPEKGYVRAVGGFYPSFPYREAFAKALRAAYKVARQVAASEAADWATVKISPEARAEVTALRERAQYVARYGSQYKELMNAADMVEFEARANA